MARQNSLEAEKSPRKVHQLSEWSPGGTQQIFGKVRKMKHFHGKVQEEKKSTMKHPRPKLMRSYPPRKNKTTLKNKVGLIRPSWTNPTATLPAFLDFICFSAMPQFSSKKSSFTPVQKEAPYGCPCHYQQYLKRIPTSKNAVVSLRPADLLGDSIPSYSGSSDLTNPQFLDAKVNIGPKPTKQNGKAF